MWTVTLVKSLALVLRTLPMHAVRLLVFAAITVGLGAASLAGAWFGHRLGVMIGTPDPAADAVIAGLGGLVLAFSLVAARRDQLLHAVQARTLALLADGIDRKPVPYGPAQLGHSTAAVTSRFGTAAELFALDRLVRGVTGQVASVADGLGTVLAFPGIARLASGSLVERVVLAHAYRARPENAWEAAHDGLVLYAQNARPVLVAAGWITLVGWLVTAGVFVALLGPVSALGALWPGDGQAGIWVLAGLCALGIRSALIEPFAFACLMQAFLAITAGQNPSPEWRGRLTQLCDRFRQLGERAIRWTPMSGAGA